MTLDLSKFSVPDDFGLETKGAPEVRTPRSDEPVRAHPEWSSEKMLLSKVGSKFYLVSPGLAQRLRGNVVMAHLVAAVTSEGEHFLWLIKWDSAAEAAEQAKNEWVKVAWDSKDKAYHAEAVKRKTRGPGVARRLHGDD